MPSNLTIPVAHAQLDETLDLLKDFTENAQHTPQTHLPSLLEQCEALCDQAPEPAPLRSIHHFACTGGSVISKCLALMPNVTLLSEIDPLTRKTIHPRDPEFSPTDLIYGARIALRPVADETVERMFLAALKVLQEDVCRDGGYLILRDHTHSHFCTDSAPPHRATMRELLQREGNVKSVLTVRHPLDSYLSLLKNNWHREFSPSTIDEYARRYLAFLERYENVARFRYEDFVSAPNDVLKQICQVLEIPFSADVEKLLPAVVLSGDSGRSSNRITPRPRAPVPPAILDEMEQSAAFAALCAALDYPTDVAKPR